MTAQNMHHIQTHMYTRLKQHREHDRTQIKIVISSFHQHHFPEDLNMKKPTSIAPSDGSKLCFKYSNITTYMGYQVFNIN